MRDVQRRQEDLQPHANADGEEARLKVATQALQTFRVTIEQTQVGRRMGCGGQPGGGGSSAGARRRVMEAVLIGAVPGGRAGVPLRMAAKQARWWVLWMAAQELVGAARAGVCRWCRGPPLDPGTPPPAPQVELSNLAGQLAEVRKQEAELKAKYLEHRCGWRWRGSCGDQSVRGPCPGDQLSAQIIRSAAELRLACSALCVMR